MRDPSGGSEFLTPGVSPLLIVISSRPFPPVARHRREPRCESCQVVARGSQKRLVGGHDDPLHARAVVADKRESFSGGIIKRLMAPSHPADTMSRGFLSFCRTAVTA